MILTGPEIKKQVAASRILLSPFCPEQVSTNSYDLRLGTKLLRYDSACLDPRCEPKYRYVDIGEEGYQLAQGDFVLGQTFENFGSDHYVPIIHGRSSTARAGLFVHITADLIDIGWKGSATLQLFATLPIKLYRGMQIAQVSFWVPEGEIELYRGKYQYADLPLPSRSWKDVR